MDEGSLARRFHDEGYLVIEDFFEPTLMDELDAVIRAHYGSSPDFWHSDEFLQKSQTEVVPWFPQNEGVAAFDAIDRDPALVTEDRRLGRVKD